MNYVYELKERIEDVVQEEKNRRMKTIVSDWNITQFDHERFNDINLHKLLFLSVPQTDLKTRFNSFFLCSYPDIHSLVASYMTYFSISTFVMYSISFYSMEIVSICLVVSSSSSSVFCLLNTFLMVISAFMSLRKIRKLSIFISIFLNVVLFVVLFFVHSL
jgi:hypothetical protein